MVQAHQYLYPIARDFGSVVKHLTADPGIASSIPLTPTKFAKRK